LYTNIIDLSGFNFGALDFWYHFNGAFGHTAGGVEVSGDGGATWDGEIVLPAGGSWQEYSLDLHAYMGNSNVQVRFHSNDGGQFAAGYAIDAVELTCAQTPDIEVDPASLEGAQPLNTQTTRPITISNVGLADLDWSIVEEPAPPRPKSVDYERGIHSPSLGAAPNDSPVTAAVSQLGEMLGSTAYSWNSQNGPYYTVFDLAVPDVLPNIAVFPAGGNFVGAGEYVDGLVYMIDIANNVYEVDPVTGNIQASYTATAPPGSETYSGMALDPTDGTVYAASTDVSLAVSSLFKMDPTTGNATLMGTITNSPGIIGIAIDGSGTLYGYDIISDTLLSIDKSSAAGTIIGPIGFDANFGQGMGWDQATDTLYMAAFNNPLLQGELRSVDRNTGNTTLLGVLGSTNPGGINQLSWLGLEIEVAETCHPTDLPWASANPTTGTTQAGSSDVVDVTFDSTGLALGVYEGILCIQSNDPVDPVLRVPLVMTVTLHNTYLPYINAGSSDLKHESPSVAAPSIGLVVLPAAAGLIPKLKRHRD
jgi:hypothetical protein